MIYVANDNTDKATEKVYQKASDNKENGNKV